MWRNARRGAVRARLAEASDHSPAVPTEEPASVLSLDGAWKAFGHVVALADASLAAFAGQIVAIVGDNGAGKSTLVKCITGVYPLDAGTLTILGRPMKSSREIKEQVGVVYQDLAVVSTLDVATNLYLERPITRAGIFVNRRAMYMGAARAFSELRVAMPSVRIPVGELSGGQRQAVAIARVLTRDCPAVVFDEPTAALGVRETAQVGDVLRRLRDQGKAVVLVSHDLEFVFKCSDRIQVMRLGRVAGRFITRDVHPNDVVGLITGASSLEIGESAVGGPR
jgi:ABC-type sugar transport system ATPase subunit